MCEYCEETTDRNGEKRTEIMTSDRGEFSIETFHGVLVFEDSAGARLEINYCPMCGRDLKGDGK